MRRLLLIAFAYPPVEIVGSVRPAALAKYLPRFGWEPIVLTPKIQGAERQSKLVVETEYRDVLGDWKARLNLDRERGVHEQFGLTTARKRGSLLPHTRALKLAKYLLTYPDPYKGWVPFALDDPAINIQWPLTATMVSEQDRNWPLKATQRPPAFSNNQL